MKFEKYFEVKDMGVMNKNVGCKIKHNKQSGWIRMTHSELVQSLADKIVKANNMHDNPVLSGTNITTRC